MTFVGQYIGDHKIRGALPKECRLNRMICPKCKKLVIVNVYATIGKNQICPTCGSNLEQ